MPGGNLYDKHGERNPRWRGGKRRRKDGYVLVYSPNHPYANKRFVLEHRLVMEAHVGRFLPPDEVVHHINKVRWDNRLENLMLTNRHEHMGHHAGEPRQKRWKAKISREALAALYWVDGLTIKECARRIGISYGATHRHFEVYGISRRPGDPWWRRKDKKPTEVPADCDRHEGAS